MNIELSMEETLGFKHVPAGNLTWQWKSVCSKTLL